MASLTKLDERFIYLLHFYPTFWVPKVAYKIVKYTKFFKQIPYKDKNIGGEGGPDY